MMMTRSRDLRRRDCESAISGGPNSAPSVHVANLFEIQPYHPPCTSCLFFNSKTGDYIEDSDEEIAELDRREAAAEAEQARLAALVPPLTLGGGGGGTPEDGMGE